MASEAQFLANRKNARKSTGPRTAAGKDAVRHNAVKHGLTARSCLLPEESVVAYEAFCAQVFAEIAPRSSLAIDQTTRLCSLLWRLRRVAQFEASVFAWVALRQAELEGSLHESDLESTRGIAGVGLRNEANLELGRCIEALLERDVTCKLSRYEAHLARQVEQVWRLLASWA